MASAFAAVKAGIIAGVLYTCLVGGFNLLIVALSRDQVLRILSTVSSCQGSIPGGQVATPQECFISFLAVLLPLVLFITFVLSLIFAFLYGVLFEFIPWRRYALKALAISVIFFASQLSLVLPLVYIDTPSYIVMVSFNAVATVLYAAVLAAFYRRYTRAVHFSSQDPEGMRVFMGKADVTGKIVTIAVNSTRKVTAKALKDSAFKEWSFSGGVTLEDARSYETMMRVAGDGLLRASSTRTT